MIVVILAGGGGTRLWPMSRIDYPKQFLHFGGEPSFLQKTALRFYKSKIADKILISTNQRYATLVRKQLSNIDDELSQHMVIEPSQRNTAPSLILCVRYILETLNVDPTEPILVLPSDHILEPEADFLAQIEKVMPYVEKGSILTFGIRPDKPETGYGYIQLGSSKGESLFNVQSFVEKPNKQLAQQYVDSGRYLWNSGIFSFNAETFLDELKQYAPEIHSRSTSLSKMLEEYSEMPSISIDYALMEKTDNLTVKRLDLDWSDVGSWDSVYEILDKDENQNVKRGRVIDIDTTNSLIFSDKRLISTIGLDDVLIVETEEAVFMAKKGESQKVKDLIPFLPVSGEAKKVIARKFSEKISRVNDYEMDILRFKKENKHTFSSRTKTVLFLLKGTMKEVGGDQRMFTDKYSSMIMEPNEESTCIFLTDTEILQLKVNT